MTGVKTLNFLDQRLCWSLPIQNHLNTFVPFRVSWVQTSNILYADRIPVLFLVFDNLSFSFGSSGFPLPLGALDRLRDFTGALIGPSI